MPYTPQSEYSYDELEHYLDVAETALANFEARYPDLSFEYIHPEMIVNEVFSSYLTATSTELLQSIAYLEPWEQDTIAVGSRVESTKKKRLQKLEDNFYSEVERIRKELDDFYHISVSSLTALALQMSHLTAKFTAERIDKHEWHKEWVKKQRQYIADYCIRECAKYNAAQGLDLLYAEYTKDIPEESGVYFLLSRGEIIYVGYSRNLFNRLNNHDVVRERYYKGENGYKVQCVYSLVPADEAKYIERKLILVSHPEANKQGKSL